MRELNAYKRFFSNINEKNSIFVSSIRLRKSIVKMLHTIFQMLHQRKRFNLCVIDTILKEHR